MPPSARVSVGLLAALAVLLLISALLTVLAWDAVVDALVEGRAESSRSDAAQVVRVNVAQSVVFGLLSAVSAVFLARRRNWARWAGVVTTALLGLITLGATVLVGGVAVSSLLVLVLCAAAVASLVVRTTAAWTAAGPRSRG